MAASEISPMKNVNVQILQKKMDLESEFRNHIELATELLLFRDFQNCQTTCMNGISHAKQHLEMERARHCMDSLCVLCIQALAEQNRWQEVLPLVQDIYTGIECCPYTVIQLCLLLHAKVLEFSQCHAIASIWLRCEDNSYKEGYVDVVSLYIKHIMLPQGQITLVPQFLNVCTVLDTGVKESIAAESAQLLTQEREPAPDDVTEEAQSEEDVQSDKGMRMDKEYISPLMKYAMSIGSYVAGKLPFLNFRIILKVAMVTASFYLVMKLAFDGDLLANSGRATVIWQGAMKIWKSMFTPYRAGR